VPLRGGHEKAAGLDVGSIRWRPGERGGWTLCSPVALRHRLSTALL